MNNFLKVSTIILGVLSLGSITLAENLGFNDVTTDHPNYQAIVELQKRGIISGYPDNSFKPDQKINRAEALKIILLGSGIDDTGANSKIDFVDLPSQAWYLDYIRKAFSIGIIQGFPDGTFRPEQTVNLVETLKMLLRTNSINLTDLKVNQNIFADAYADQWYAKYVQYAKENNLITADLHNKIYPDQSITRGKLAEIMYRLIILYRGLMPIQKHRAEEITSLFENGTVEIDYAFAKNLDDGRGITAGRAGFTTATGDAYEVIKRYTKKVPSNPLAKYLSELKELMVVRSDDTSNLQGVEKAWAGEAINPLFKEIQDEVVEDYYFYPAMKHADELGLIFPLSRAVLYDTVIQHGDGNDPDGLPALIQRTNTEANGSPKEGIDEKKWLGIFLQIRTDDLLNAYDEETRVGWANSAGRCDVFLQIAHDGNYTLKGPIVVKTTIYHGTIL